MHIGAVMTVNSSNFANSFDRAVLETFLRFCNNALNKLNLMVERRAILLSVLEEQFPHFRDFHI